MAKERANPAFDVRQMTYAMGGGKKGALISHLNLTKRPEEAGRAKLAASLSVAVAAGRRSSISLARVSWSSKRRYSSSGRLDRALRGVSPSRLEI